MISQGPGHGAEIAALLDRSFDSARQLVAGGATVGEIAAMAAWLGRRLDGLDKQTTVCLATENRALIAAALLTALADGPVMVLPYSLSGQALDGVRRTTGCTVVLADAELDVPAAMEVIKPPEGLPAIEVPLFHARLAEHILCLYTGGSTGAPQLWPKTGINLLGEALFLAARFAVTPQDRIVATIAPTHIYGLLYSVLLPLVAGACVVQGSPSFPEEIHQAVQEHAATILVSVPPHYRALRGKGQVGASLRLAFSSAGRLDLADNTEFCRQNGVDLVEVYGSTETGGVGLRSRFQGEIGFTPYASVDWHIRDQRLLIRSPYLSPGLPKDGQGWFVTGDRVDAVGATGFQLKGRADSITKVGGKRVDLEQIREAIQQLSGVVDCLVLALPDGGGREHRIVALAAGQRITSEAIRTALTGTFEPYALPRAIRVIDRLPVKENGKIDREAVLHLFAP